MISAERDRKVPSPPKWATALEIRAISERATMEAALISFI